MTSSRRNTPLLIVAALTALLVVGAIIAVLVRPGADPVDADSPSGVAQRYAEYVLAGDIDAAMTLLSSEVSAGCEPADTGYAGGQRVTLVSERISGDSATVSVNIAEPGAGIFGTSDYQYTDRFTLVNEAGAWRVYESPWPYMLCYPMEQM